MFRVLCPLLALLVAIPAFAGEADAAAVEAAAKKAVTFLKAQQNPDGTFGKAAGAPMPGMVGITLKALASSPEKLRENDPAVKKAVDYLLSKQLPSGAIAIPQFGLENYNTSVAVIGLAALENPAHKDVLEKAKKSILSNQLDEEEGYSKDEHTRAYGSFGYGNSKRGDLSNTAFSMEALDALGFPKDSKEYKNAILFIKRTQDNDETNDAKEMKGGDNTGGFVYLPGDSEFGNATTRSGKSLPKPYGNMTYQAVKSLIYAGMSKDDPVMQAAFKWIKNNYSAKENPGGKGTQGYFYYANAFAKAFTVAGMKEVELADGRKANWAKDLATHLISLQKDDGSFVNPDKRWMEDDPVLATAYALDALNLCLKAMK
ncbi:MAG TPA: prenyltransferase/squalene oxidase repeat-containing protein [Planctomycetota bacterium]|nr:prenyltransferase/squalene oxidase repeat-containing protein [Planctomycetota bacterium]